MRPVRVILPEWLKTLRTEAVVRPVQQHPHTTSRGPLGLTPEECWQAIDGGQADFDEPWHHLSGEERVLLYAYWNQLGHLEELTEAFRQLFDKAQTDKPSIIIDLGCGPFTGGLALAGVYGSDYGFSYAGVDRSKEMRKFGKHLAKAASRFEQAPPIKHTWVADPDSASWNNPPGWHPVLVIVSYLLASPSLDVRSLVHKLDRLLSRIGRGEVTLLYTNSPRSEANRLLPDFKKALGSIGFEEKAGGAGEILGERGIRTLSMF